MIKEKIQSNLEELEERLLNWINYWDIRYSKFDTFQGHHKDNWTVDIQDLMRQINFKEAQEELARSIIEEFRYEMRAEINNKCDELLKNL